MQLLRASRSIDPANPVGPCALAIGIFDGVHRGHQLLLQTALTLARRDQLVSAVFTFDPHPAQVLSAHEPPKLIEPIETRLERLAALGFDTVVVEEFDADFARMPADIFVREVLQRRMAAKHVVVGENFTFGHKQLGHVDLLRALSRTAGFEVHPQPLHIVDGTTVTSSKIRELVWAGAMRGATRLLGRPFALSGLVVRGAGRGVSLGFGTANLESHNELLPDSGIYACVAVGNFGRRAAAVSIGYSPTFGPRALTIEAHLLDYEGGSLYGRYLTLEFIDRLRAEEHFPTVAALQAQVAKDIETTRALVAPHLAA